MPTDLARYGDVLEIEPPRAKLRVHRRDVGRVMGAILDQHTMDDISVEDPPLEEVIAEVFSQAEKTTKEEDDARNDGVME